MALFISRETPLLFDLPKLGPLLTIDDFTPHVGESYLVDAHPQPIPLRLDEVLADLGEAWMERQPFILLFSTPWEALLVEGLYRLTRGPGATPVELHIMPINAPPGPRRIYQSVMN